MQLFLKVFNLLRCLDKGSTPEFQLLEYLGEGPGDFRENSVSITLESPRSFTVNS